ncbi:MAG: hypothetical protein WC979_05245 [Candidatus Pacearchaeota archaeon]|jgi:hypothetical protein
MRREFVVAVIVSILFTISFVFASHIITPLSGSSYNVNEDVDFIYTMSVNNTDNENTANITQVNITLPSGFIFESNSNGSDSSIDYSFVNTSNVLSWENVSGLVMNLTLNNFWFNASSSTPGSYNLSVTTTNSTDVYSFNISILVNDTTVPVISLQSPSNSYSSTSSSVDFTFRVTDSSATNCSLILDGVITNINLSVDVSGAVNNLFTNITSVNNHTWSINCTDIYQNTANSSTGNFSITSASSSSSSEPNSYSGVIGQWLVTWTISSADFQKGFSKELSKNNRVKIVLNNTDKYVGLLTFMNNSVALEISNNSQLALISVGEEKKYDLNNDGYYDATVKLESVSSTKARINMKYLYEKIGSITSTNNSQLASLINDSLVSEEEKAVPTTPVDKPNILFNVVLGVIIALILMIAAAFIIVRHRKKNSFY